MKESMKLSSITGKNVYNGFFPTLSVLFRSRWKTANRDYPHHVLQPTLFLVPCPKQKIVIVVLKLLIQMVPGCSFQEHLITN